MFCRQTADGVLLSLHVQPRASRNEITDINGEELKVRLTSPPVDGMANRLCCEFFAKLLAVPKSKVSLAAGEKSRHKRLLVREITEEEARRAIAATVKRR